MLIMDENQYSIRDRGFGKQAIKRIIELERQRMYIAEVRLHVRMSNLRTIACYKSCGFYEFDRYALSDGISIISIKKRSVGMYNCCGGHQRVVGAAGLQEVSNMMDFIKSKSMNTLSSFRICETNTVHQDGICELDMELRLDEKLSRAELRKDNANENSKDQGTQ